MHTGSGPQNWPLVKDAQELLLALKNGQYVEEKLDADVKLWRLTRKDNTWLTAKTQALYERKTCAEILKMVETRLKRTNCATNAGVIIGHVPGIGKTMFLNRLLIQIYRLSQSEEITQKKVLFFHRRNSVFLLFNFETCTVKKVEQHEGERMIKMGNRDDLIVLDDPADTTRGPVCFGPHYFAAMCGGSNKQQHFANSRKDAHTPNVTMDPLTEEEAIVILRNMHPKAGFSKDDVRNVYREWGGSLRRLNAALLKGDDFHDLTSRREDAFRAFGSHVQSDLDGLPMGMAERIKKSSYSHHFYHEWRDPSASKPCQSIQLRIASSNIIDRVHDALVLGGRSQLCQFIQHLHPTSPHHWEGFEALMHHDIVKGGEFIFQRVEEPQVEVPWDELSANFFDVHADFPFQNIKDTRSKYFALLTEEEEVGSP